MATATINGVQFTWPDDPCLVFNPCLISVSHGVSRVEVFIGGLKATYHARNGECIADVRSFLRSGFDDLKMGKNLITGKSELGKNVSITIRALASDNTLLAQHNVTIFCIWGCTKAGETFDSPFEFVAFEGYSFTLCKYFPAADNIDIYEVSGGVETLYTTENITSKGIWNFNLSLLSGYDGYVMKKSGTSIVYATVKILPYREGAYLRWVDRHGFWRYWLFKEGNPQRTSASRFGAWTRIDYDDWNAAGHWQGDSGRRQSYTRNDVQPLCAPLVGQDTFDMLQDITTSPCVDMVIGLDGYGNEIWSSVTVEPGSYTKDVKKPEQDFLCNIILPEIPVQTL